MSFDLSIFPEIGKFLFDCAANLYKSLEFKFGDFTVNGWALLISVAVVFIIVWFIGRISE